MTNFPDDTIECHLIQDSRRTAVGPMSVLHQELHGLEQEALRQYCNFLNWCPLYILIALNDVSTVDLSHQESICVSIWHECAVSDNRYQRILNGTLAIYLHANHTNSVIMADELPVVLVSGGGTREILRTTVTQSSPLCHIYVW